MPVIEVDDAPRPGHSTRKVLSNCPECGGDLAVLRVIAGRAGCEYWTSRCTDCGGVHLDILKRYEVGEDGEGPTPAG